MRVFFQPDPNNIQHHLPNPVTSMPVLITSGTIVLIAIIAHPPNWFGRILSFMLWPTTLLVSVPAPNKLWNFHYCGTWRQSIWVLHPQRISTLYSRHILFNAFILAFPEVTHRLLKFSIAIPIAWAGFSRGVWRYLFVACTILFCYSHLAKSKTFSLGQLMGSYLYCLVLPVLSVPTGFPSCHCY